MSVSEGIDTFLEDYWIGKVGSFGDGMLVGEGDGWNEGILVWWWREGWQDEGRSRGKLSQRSRVGANI